QTHLGSFLGQHKELFGVYERQTLGAEIADQVAHGTRCRPARIDPSPKRHDHRRQGGRRLAIERYVVHLEDALPAATRGKTTMRPWCSGRESARRNAGSWSASIIARPSTSQEAPWRREAPAHPTERPCHERRHALDRHLDGGAGAGRRRRLQQPYAANDPAGQHRWQPAARTYVERLWDPPPGDRGGPRWPAQHRFGDSAGLQPTAHLRR